MKKRLLAASLLISAALTVSCQERYTVPSANEMPACTIFPTGDTTFDNMTDIDLKSAYIVEQLEQYGDIPRFTNKIIVTTFVDINNLNKTSMFGRLIAEEVLSKLHMKGYRVTDVREMKSIVMSNKIGELYLSRGDRNNATDQGYKIDVTPKNFNFDYTNTLILAGTYQSEPCDVFVNVRLISPELGEVISVASVKLPRTSMIHHLLSKANDLKEEQMPAIKLRQIDDTPVVKKAPEPTPAPKKKVQKPKTKAKKPAKKYKPAKSAPKSEATATSTEHPEPATKVLVTPEPKEPTIPETAKPHEPTAPAAPTKPGEPAKNKH